MILGRYVNKMTGLGSTTVNVSLQASQNANQTAACWSPHYKQQSGSDQVQFLDIYTGLSSVIFALEIPLLCDEALTSVSPKNISDVICKVSKSLEQTLSLKLFVCSAVIIFLMS